MHISKSIDGKETIYAQKFCSSRLVITDNSSNSDERERSGSVVEFLTRDRGAVGSSLTGVTVLWSLSKTHLS